MTSALLALALVLAARAQVPGDDERHTRDAPAAEGALDNDVFVAVLEGVPLAALEEGDRALARARAAAQSVERERQLDLAFDGWRAALAGAPAGARVWLGSERRCAEGLHAGVLRRLADLAPAERERYGARLAPLAEAARVDARQTPGEAARERALLEVVRLFPGTTAAVRSVLELVDHALEAGRSARARALVARAELELGLAPASELGTALARRRAALPPVPTEQGAWRNAQGMLAAGTCTFEALVPGSGLERRMRPGAAFLAPGRFVIQTALELLCFELGNAPRTGNLSPWARVRPAEFLDGLLLANEAPREPPGWPLLPLADADGVVLVHGRALPEDSNVLLALTLEPPRSDLGLGLGLELGQSHAAASLAWALIGARLVHPGSEEDVPELEALGTLEFQPGPVLAGERVLVQVRSGTAPLEAWLLAVERRSGAFAWLRPMARGADRVAQGRMAGLTKRVAAQPLLAFEREDEARVLVGTHLGLAVLVDALDGEPLWSFKNRRRPLQETGWTGDRPLLATDGSALLWAPMDSDRMYALTPGRLTTGSADPRLRPVVPLAEAQSLLGGSLDEQLVTGARGKERTVSLRRSGRDRVDALDLGPDEQFRGQGLTSAQRVWVATQRALYLFDRERELYLLDSEPLPASGGVPAGGDVLAHGDEVLVVGLNALWRFRTR